MPIVFNADRSPAHIYTRTNAGVFSTDLANTANFDYFPNNITVGDAIYFSCVHAGLPGSGIAQKALGQFRNIKFNIGTALSAVGLTLTWEYFADAPSAGGATKEEIRVEMDTNSIKLKNIDQNVGGLY